MNSDGDDKPRCEINEDAIIAATVGIEDEIINALKYANQEGCEPSDMWHPEYGWVMRDGKVTEAGRKLARNLWD